ncbi:MAG: hypothetical protein AAGJ54_06905 [Planctomycetota bacterium]
MRRRGAAMLIVLAALVIIASAAVTTARLAMTSRAATQHAQSSEHLDDLRVAAEQIALDWLRRDAGGVVLPDGVDQPRVAVLHDEIFDNETELRVAITAFDQRGMLRLGQFQDLDIELDGSVEEEEIETSSVSSSRSGLDLFSRNESSPRRVFPRFVPAEPVVHGEGRADADPRWPDGRDRFVDVVLEPTIGERLATHPAPVLRARRNNSATITLNAATAPIDLIDDVLDGTNPGVLASIREARSKDEPDQPPTGSYRIDDRTRLVLTATSDAWAFRVDLSCDGMSRAWWIVYERGERGWYIAQRLIIDG